MPMQEVTNISQGRLIHIDTVMIPPGASGMIDAERAKSKAVKMMVDAQELKLGAVQPDDEGEEPAPKPQMPQTPKPPGSPPPKG